MDKNTPITWSPFEAYMNKFQGYLEGRFQKIDNRFDVIDDRFCMVDDRFDSIEKNLSQQIEDLAFASKTGFDHMDEQFTDVKQEISILQGDMKDAKKYIQTSSIESSSNRVRLQNLEAHIA